MVMQSYNDFTVGGSLSVNVHGRTITHGSLIETIDSIKVLLANGSIVTASRSENSDLFKAAIGGYGALGIIIEATFPLTDNITIERDSKIMGISRYPEYFKNMVRNNPSVVFHNANISVSDYNKVETVTWHNSDKPLTITDRFQKNSVSAFDFFVFQTARYSRGIQKYRLPSQVMKTNEMVALRNHEMSTSVTTVEPFSRMISTTVLQEYFVPCDQLENFVEKLQQIVKRYDVNMMNISIRYIHRDKDSVMAYAQSEESFALVCYINMRNNKAGMQKAANWTQEAIDAVLSCGGTYYLPYQLHATKKQFLKAYPRAGEFLKIKKSFDPNNRFNNSFVQKYLL
jgi:FAD/FMN-containing dehydrogenase